MATHYHNKKWNVAPTGPGRKAKLCRQFSGNVGLYQRGRDNFATVYGLEVHDQLTYGEACSRLGQALMHELACESRLDNREKGER